MAEINVQKVRVKTKSEIDSSWQSDENKEKDISKLNRLKSQLLSRQKELEREIKISDKYFSAYLFIVD